MGNCVETICRKKREPSHVEGVGALSITTGECEGIIHAGQAFLPHRFARPVISTTRSLALLSQQDVEMPKCNVDLSSSGDLLTQAQEFSRKRMNANRLHSPLTRNAVTASQTERKMRCNLQTLKWLLAFAIAFLHISLRSFQRSITLPCLRNFLRARANLRKLFSLLSSSRCAKQAFALPFAFAAAH